MHETVPVIAQRSLVLWTESGGQAIDKGDTVEWPKEDFERARKSGLIRAVAAGVPSPPASKR